MFDKTYFEEEVADAARTEAAVNFHETTCTELGSLRIDLRELLGCGSSIVTFCDERLRLLSIGAERMSDLHVHEIAAEMPDRRGEMQRLSTSSSLALALPLSRAGA